MSELRLKPGNVISELLLSLAALHCERDSTKCWKKRWGERDGSTGPFILQL